MPSACSRRPSVTDVARACGVSPSTVCRALNAVADINAETRQRIIACCARLGYSRDAAASAMRGRRPTVLACLMPDQGHELYIDKLFYLKEAVRRAGLAWRFYGYADAAEGEMYLGEILESRPAGLIFHLNLTPDLRRRLRAAALPAVTYDLELPGFDGVALDRQGGCQAAVGHLLAQGRRRIFLLGSGLEEERGWGYTAAHAAAQVAVQPELIGGRPGDRDLYEYGRRETAAALGRVRFDALFAVNDAAAIGALHALRAAGLRTPQDVAVIGFDDIMAAAHAAPPLTTVAQPKEQMAVECVRLLQQRRQQPAAPRGFVRLAPELRLRESA